MSEPLKIPRFQSEKEEADWWYQHREEADDRLIEAIERGETKRLSEVIAERRQRSGVTPTVSIRIDPEDITRARSLAARKGLRYQTYLKMLLHEALEREERAS